MSGERVSVRLFLFRLIREKRIRSYRGLLRALSGLGYEQQSDVYRYALKERLCLMAYFRSMRYGRTGRSGNRQIPVRG